MTEEGHGLLLPLPPGVSASVDVMGFFPLLDGCKDHIPSAYMAFFRPRELDWERARTDTGLEDPFFPYDFRRAAVGNFP